jgi:hypothetical protein
VFEQRHDSTEDGCRSGDVDHRRPLFEDDFEFGENDPGGCLRVGGLVGEVAAAVLCAVIDVVAPVVELAASCTPAERLGVGGSVIGCELPFRWLPVSQRRSGDRLQRVRRRRFDLVEELVDRRSTGRYSSEKLDRRFGAHERIVECVVCAELGEAESVAEVTEAFRLGADSGVPHEWPLGVEHSQIWQLETEPAELSTQDADVERCVESDEHWRLVIDGSECGEDRVGEISEDRFAGEMIVGQTMDPQRVEINESFGVDESLPLVTDETSTADHGGNRHSSQVVPLADRLGVDDNETSGAPEADDLGSFET